MSIDQIYSLANLTPEDLSALTKILDSIHQKAVGVEYGSQTTGSAAIIPAGKLYVVDDNTTIRLYFKTGEGNVGYVTMTKL